MRSSIGLTLMVAVGLGAAVVSCNKHDKGPGGGDGGTGGPNYPDKPGHDQNKDCPGGTTTTLTGKVFAPNGTLPLYNAIVYIPSAPPSAFTEGVTCDRCNGSITGNPVAQALTDATGSFTLTDVPPGKDLPLVIQLGKWRRQVVVPSVPACKTTALDAGETRLPRNQSEGDIPKMAIATGNADPLECLLLKIGIDPAEITIPTGSGRIHFYRGATNPGTKMMDAPSEGDLYSDIGKLMGYDMVLLPCEGTEHYKKTTDAQRQLLVQYLNAGGRVFATHYSYQWLTYPDSPFNKITKSPGGDGMWAIEQEDYFDDTIMGALNTGFPKGMAFSQWLTAAGSKSPMGQLGIFQGRHDITDIDPKYAQDWINYDFSVPPSGVDKVDSGNGVMHLTFNTPLDPPLDDMGAPQYCGRTVFSDFHVTADAVTDPRGTFPSACKMDPLTDQEKALAFMLFDLSSCVQDDKIPPIP